MQQFRQILRHPAVALGFVLAAIGIAVLTAALADAEGAQHPAGGQAIPDRRLTDAPALALSPRPAAGVSHPEPSLEMTGELNRPLADLASVSRSGAFRRFLYGAAAMARKQSWAEAQTGTPRTYVAGQIPAEFQMGGAMSSNP